MFHCPYVPTALDGFVIGDIEKDFMLNLIRSRTNRREKKNIRVFISHFVYDQSGLK